METKLLTYHKQVYKLATLNLSAGTAEDLNVNTVAVDFTAVSGATFTAADLTNVYVKLVIQFLLYTLLFQQQEILSQYLQLL